MEKAGSALVLVPSLARPKLAQAGLFWKLKLRGVPVGLATVGREL